MQTNVDVIYQQYIKPLPKEEQLQLLAEMAKNLVGTDVEDPVQNNIMELHGLGAEIWKGVDPDEYVNELRDEWEKPVQ